MKNKVLGSTLIIAGTAVGAGMLAMPLTSAQIGFGLTFTLLTLLWILLTFTAVLYAEVHQYNSKDAGIATLAEQYFGSAGRLFVNFVLLFFMYAVLTAYVTGSGDLLMGILPESMVSNPHIVQKIASLIFAIGLGAIVTVGISLADVANRISFSLKIIIFVVILAVLLNKVSFENLQAAPTNNLLFFSAMPVFFMTFGFHICTPTINEYLGGDHKKVKIACILGATAIFIIYVVWQFSTHGVLKQSVLIEVLNKNPSLNGLIEAFRVTTGSLVIAEMVRIFSLLALITSYIGVALGLSNAVKDLLMHFKLRHDRITIGLITFVPPIIVGFTYPQIFLSAFAFAGIIFAFIGVILPVMMAHKSRQLHPEGDHTRGGAISLVLAIAFAVIIMVAYLLSIFTDVLPKVVG
ncbi:amino acid permease [Wohlfahrtiimonas chitiniclastica]|uniref:amino acid permease n=1 Tax=Wohlfahrtiimonas chitiniclastica TaxID=400946 RepID=UPI001BCD1E03|nr:aromatic amino acid transport family protein [Wohlfahrtiimonas chitiniclastica]MBS7834669.1 amino acid permease [Wohlfahrtiimonas chitiniclastica]